MPMDRNKTYGDRQSEAARQKKEQALQARNAARKPAKSSDAAAQEHNAPKK